MSAVTDLEHEARETALVELVEVLREHASEAVGQVGEPGMWPDALRRESAAFAMVADWVDREFLGREPRGAALGKEEA